ncbi:MAG: helix-turn-helix domain-containing protein [Faecousia sp.]
MNYESAQQAADRLGVTIGTIRKWAKEGRIPGAARRGRSWMIPADFAPAEQQEAQPKQVELQMANDGRLIRIAMPLMNSAYPVGKCREFIETIPDEDDRAIAWGEYYYYSGQAELAAKTMEPYQGSTDPALRYSANLVGFFANFARGYTHLAMQAFEQLQADLQKDLRTEYAPLLQAIGVFTVTASSVLLHLPMVYDVNLQQYICYLPDGLKLWACYMLAHKAYLEKNYNGSLAMAELALSMNPQLYPVGTIYVHLVAAMNLMSLKRVEEAKRHIAQAWALAQHDGFIEPFGEHHGLLQGMIELFFQKDYPEAFEKIIAITYSFSAGWRKIHSRVSKHEVADNLTTTEFTIAMLYNHGWTAKEIAAYMILSPRTITNTIQVIYQKLGISSKRELGQFMLV